VATYQVESLLKTGCVSLRVAELSEADAIIEFVNESFRGPYVHREDLMDAGRFEALWQRGKFLLAEKGGSLAGCVYVEPNSNSSILDLLVVNAKVRRSGIGTQLILAAEGLCQGVKSSFIHIKVANQNCEMVRFWHRRGYVDFDQIPCSCEPRSSLECYVLKMAKQLKRRSPGF
jgi:N-acetylglutamate synthase-like GNAT family acetyltransferase